MKQSTNLTISLAVALCIVIFVGLHAASKQYARMQQATWRRTHRVENLGDHVEMLTVDLRPAGSAVIENTTNVSIKVPGGYSTGGPRRRLYVNIQPDTSLGVYELRELAGISPDYVYEIPGNRCRQNAPPIMLPPNTYTYLQVYDTYVRHWGFARIVDANGVVSIKSYDFSIPLPPGSGLSMIDPQPICGKFSSSVLPPSKSAAGEHLTELRPQF